MTMRPQYLTITHQATGVTSLTGAIIPMIGETATEATEAMEAQSETIEDIAKEAVEMIITDITKEAEAVVTHRMIEATTEAAEILKMIEPKINSLGGRAHQARAGHPDQLYLKHKGERY